MFDAAGKVRSFPSRPLSPAQGVLVVALGTLVVPFDSAVNVAFPSIIQALHLPLPSIQWVVISYTLTYAALMLVFGRAGDMLGYRRVFLLGTGCSTCAFMLCGAAPDFAWLMAGRIVQGLGAAMALSCGPALATSLYPESERTRILGLYTMAFGIGGAAGPLVAGALLQAWGWQAVFWFRAPIAALAFVLAWGLPRSPVRTGQNRFDAVGAVLMVTTVSAMLLALNQLQRLPASIVWFCSFAALFAAGAVCFVRWEKRTPHRMIDLSFFRRRDFTLVNVAHWALNLAGFSIMLLAPFYLDRVAHLPPWALGLVLAVSNIGLMLSAPIAGRIASRVAPKRLALLGACCMAIGQSLIGTANATPNLPLLVAAMFMQGTGLGLFQVAYFDIVTGVIPREDRGVAGSLVMMTRTIGVVSGATVLMLIFQTLRASAEAQGVDQITAFLTGFQGAFRAAALLPIAVVIAALLRGWARSPREAPATR